MSDNQQGAPQGTGGNQTSGVQQSNSGTTAGAQGYRTDPNSDIVIPEYTEELVPEKVEQQEGTVHVHKDVVSEQQTVSAPVTHEQVSVDRVPVHNQFDTPPADAFKGEDIDIPLTGEQLVAGKQVVETEEVRLRKQQVQEQEQVTGTVRREDVEVDQPGQTANIGTTTAQAAPIDTTSSNVSTMQTAPTQDTMTESAPVRITSDTSATPVTSAPRTPPVQGASSTTIPDQETMRQGATYRIEAEPVDDTLGQPGTVAEVQGTASPAGAQVKSGAQQAASNAQQGASNAKGKLDSAIDNVADKLFGHNH